MGTPWKKVVQAALPLGLNPFRDTTCRIQKHELQKALKFGVNKGHKVCFFEHNALQVYWKCQNLTRTIFSGSYLFWCVWKPLSCILTLIVAVSGIKSAVELYADNNLSLICLPIGFHKTTQKKRALIIVIMSGRIRH